MIAARVGRTEIAQARTRFCIDPINLKARKPVRIIPAITASAESPVVASVLFPAIG